jgi:tRNA(Glu) U13 pseudouridine synthase TruD
VIAHKIYKDLIAVEGIDISDIKRLETNFMVQGGWRRLIGQAEGLEWKFIEHDTKEVDLVTITAGIAEVNDLILDTRTDVADQKKPAGEYFKSLLLEFSLKKSTYATMLIREILNTSSSLKIQNEINEKVKAL